MNSRYLYAYHDPKFPETDEVPLETGWHRKQINFLVELLESHFDEREDFYAQGNMFVYYDPADSRKNAGPDVFYVNGVNRWPERRIWAVWEEGGRFPDVIVELMSPKTKNKDRKTNKDLYEQVFRTPEYFMYDRDSGVLEGWRLADGVYRPITPNAAGWMWSEQLRLWLGACESTYYSGQPAVWLRLFEPDGRMVPTFHERERQRAEESDRRAQEERRRREESERRAEEEQRRREESERRAEEEQRRREESDRRAEEERRRREESDGRAEEERRRAEAAEAELARLRALLQQSDDGEQTNKDGS